MSAAFFVGALCPSASSTSLVYYALGATVSMILQRRRATRNACGGELVTSSKDYAVAQIGAM
jgi:hypothetical protein